MFRTRKRRAVRWWPEDARSPRRDRAIGRGAARRRVRRGARVARTRAGADRAGSDAARETAGRARVENPSRSRLAIFSTTATLRYVTRPTRVRGRARRRDASVEVGGRRIARGARRATRSSERRREPRAADRVGTRRRGGASRLRVSPLRRKAAVPRKFRRASAPETGRVGARDVPGASRTGVRVRAPACATGGALCDRP